MKLHGTLEAENCEGAKKRLKRTGLVFKHGLGEVAEWSKALPC